MVRGALGDEFVGFEEELFDDQVRQGICVAACSRCLQCERLCEDLGWTMKSPKAHWHATAPDLDLDRRPCVPELSPVDLIKTAWLLT